MEKEMKRIPLTQGKYAIVDDEDFEELSKVRWYYDYRYAARNLPRCNKIQRTIRMHQVVMQTPKGMDTDHINGNKLDNRRENLRICARSQNHANKNKLSNNTSGFKGVTFDKRLQKWLAQIYIQNKKIYIGVFEKTEDAARAYNKAAKKYFGKFAKLNSIT